MGAWQSGRAGALEAPFSARVEKIPTLHTFVGRVLEFIPIDVIALYAAAITALVDDPKDDPNGWLVVGGVFLSLVAVPLGAAASSTNDWWNRKVKFRTAMAPIAFLIWSPSVPNSGWQSLDWVADHRGVTVVLCAFAAYLFALSAQAVEKRL